MIIHQLSKFVLGPPGHAQAAMAELQKDAFRAHMAFLADDLPGDFFGENFGPGNK